MRKLYICGNCDKWFWEQLRGEVVCDDGVLSAEESRQIWGNVCPYCGALGEYPLQALWLRVDMFFWGLKNRALKISLCKNCWCMTKTIEGKCGKCKARKEANKD